MKALPNILSIFRICLVPAFVVAYWLDEGSIRIWAIGIFVVANASDILDGYIARKYDAQTSLGKVLDPLGDRLIIFAALVCLTISTPVLIWAPSIYFVIGVLMAVGGGLLSRSAHIELPHSNWLGKTATVYFFSVCVAIMIFDSFISASEYGTVITVALMSSAVIISLAAFINYLYTFVRLYKNRTPQESNVNGEDA